MGLIFFQQDMADRPISEGVKPLSSKSKERHFHVSLLEDLHQQM